MLYFAYGSNMVLEHMRRLCGWHCHVLERAVLPGYEIGLDHRGYANIRLKEGEEVHGVLFELDQEAIDALDAFEGYPTVFDRVEVTVKDGEGQERKAWVYIEPADQFGGTAPRMEYFNRVIAGAKENHLPEAWVNKLKTLVRKE